MSDSIWVREYPHPLTLKWDNTEVHICSTLAPTIPKQN